MSDDDMYWQKQNRPPEPMLRTVEGCMGILFGLILSGLLLWIAYIGFLVWGHHG